MSETTSLFPTAELASVDTDIRQRIEAVQEKAGFVPAIFLALAHRPDEFRAFFAYHDTLMERPGNLTVGEKEMIVVATSGLNQCLYCVVAHGAILRIREKNPLIADQLATNYRKAEITARQRTMLDYAVKVSQSSHELTINDHLPLLEAGFNQDDIWTIGAIAAFFAMSNRLANMSSLRPNSEFYSMGR
ncbi:MAG: peroxidase-related enzyme [Gammaproteobacteria bacterium]|nr:peroxidase-related enzyme [Gammaproteobacteria bacterium]